MAAKGKDAPPVARPVFTNDQIVAAATGKWGEIAQDLKPAEPFEIQVPESDGKVITVPPLTRRRRKALKAAQGTYLMMGAQLAEISDSGDADQGTISRVQTLIDEAEAAYDKALFGDAYDEVVELFEDLQDEWWDVMYKAVHSQLVNRVQLPEDVCSKCGQEVKTEGDDEGKDESSSTSGTVTPLKSKATSGTT
jgi:hypothetical protein